MTDQDLLIIGTLVLPLRDIYSDIRMGLTTDCMSGLSPFVMGIEPSWRSILVNKTLA